MKRSLTIPLLLAGVLCLGTTILFATANTPGERQVADSAVLPVALERAADRDSLGGVTHPVENYLRARLQNAIQGLTYDSGFAERSSDWRRVLAEAPGSEDFAAALKRGAAEMDRNVFVDAIQAYTQAALLAPENAEAYFALGEALVCVGETDKSIAAFRTVLRNDPDLIGAHYQLGLNYSRKHDFTKALESFRHVVHAEPNHTKGHERLAVTLYYVGDFTGAWEHVHTVEALGANVAPQFRTLLESRMAEPPS